MPDNLFPIRSAADVPTALTQVLAAARRVVVFTGAGISAESGIPTFRDGKGSLWKRFDARTLATPEAFGENPAMVWGWYEYRRAAIGHAQPNGAHLAVAQLSRHVSKLDLITQNVDDLHERAGSPDVIHLHGRLDKARCHDCGLDWEHPCATPDLPQDDAPVPPPNCTRCGGPIRPGVVWFGEALPEHDWRRAMEVAEQCDVLISIGTSSMVYPAAELPHRARTQGARVIQVNPAPTPMDAVCDFNLRGDAGLVMPAVLTALQALRHAPGESGASHSV